MLSSVAGRTFENMKFCGYKFTISKLIMMVNTSSLFTILLLAIKIFHGFGKF